jgi:hypothetical protein
MRLVYDTAPSGGINLSSHGDAGSGQRSNVASFSDTWVHHMPAPELKASAYMPSAGSSYLHGAHQQMQSSIVVSRDRTTLPAYVGSSSGVDPHSGQTTAENMVSAPMPLNATHGYMIPPQHIDVHERRAHAPSSNLPSGTQAAAWTDVNTEFAFTTSAQQVGFLCLCGLCRANGNTRAIVQFVQGRMSN